MDFKNANELLALCEEKNLPISEIMRIREIELGETASEIVNKKMTRVLGIMKDAAFSPIRQPVKSMGGLIGGEARKLSLHAQEKKVSAEICFRRQLLMLWLHWKRMPPWGLSWPLLLPVLPESYRG